MTTQEAVVLLTPPLSPGAGGLDTWGVGATRTGAPEWFIVDKRMPGRHRLSLTHKQGNTYPTINQSGWLNE